jgi:hypothetical protein
MREMSNNIWVAGKRMLLGVYVCTRGENGMIKKINSKRGRI